MLRITVYVFVFSPDAEKYGPEKSPYLDTFRAVHVSYDIHTSTVGYAMKYRFKLIQWKKFNSIKKSCTNQTKYCKIEHDRKF